MSKLAEEITLDGVVYTRVDEKPSAYIYKYSAGERDNFEVFKRQRDKNYNEVFPQEEDFGNTAFSCNSINEAMTQFNKM